MISLAPEASAQLEALDRFYVEKQRPQALCNPGQALAEASPIILNVLERRIPAQRALLALPWLKRGRYWIAYDPAGPIIAAVFFETDGIPNRLG